MKSIKRTILQLIAALLSAIIVLSSAPTYAVVVNDINKSSSYAKDAIIWMVTNNVVSGDSKGNFDPQRKITRAELVTLIVKSLGIDTSNLPSTPTYRDVPVTHWAFSYVEAANRAGIMSGTGNGNFGINQITTREQITAILLNYLSVSKEAILANQGLADLDKFIDRDKMSDWAKAAIQFAVANNIMSGTGIDTFSPSSSATKEQLAVILYKFLKNKDSLNQVADGLRSPIVTFNGDVIKASEQTKLTNDEIFVPLETLDKVGLLVTVDPQKAYIFIKNPKDATKNIYMQTGITGAYINYTGTGNPFVDIVPEGKSITLNNAPSISGTDIVVPLKAVADAVGITMDWNIKTNLVALTDSAVQKYPLLYNAYKNSIAFKGEYTVNMSILMKESISQEQINMESTISGAVNGENSTSKAKTTIKIPGYNDQVMESDVVVIGEQIFSKDLQSGTWTTISAIEAEDLNIIFYDVKAEKNGTQRILDVFDKLIVVPRGKLILSGQEVYKYEFNISKDIMKSLMPDTLGDSGVNFEELYRDGVQMKAEVYLNNKGQLVKQTIKLSGVMTNPDYKIQLIMQTESILTNIGKDIEIVNPIQ